MRKFLIKIIIRLIVLVLIFSLASYIHVGMNKAEAQTEDIIRVGLPVPETGGASRWGTFCLRGALLAEQQINNTGGVLGKKIKIIKSDSQGIPDEAVSAAQRMIHRDKVHLFIAAMNSSETKALQPIVEEAKIPMVAAASSDPEITYRAGVGGFKWTFRNYPTEEIRTLVLLEYTIKEKGFSKFSMLAVDNDFGRSAVTFTQKYLPRFPNARFASFNFFSLKEVDFRPVLSKIKAAGSEVICLYTNTTETMQVMGRQMRELGLAGKVRIMGLGDITHPENIKALQEVLEGAIEVTLWQLQWDHPRSRQFVEDYNKMFSEAPNVLAYSYWETTHLVAQAIKNAKSLKNEDIYKALKAIKYESVMGTIYFDDHNQSNMPMVLLEVVNGKPVIKGTFWSRPDYPTKTKQ